MSITVYSKPACVQCNATYRHLDKKGLEYTTVDISKDPDARQTIMDKGFMRAPVVVVDGDWDNAWSGYQDDKINALVES